MFPQDDDSQTHKLVATETVFKNIPHRVCPNAKVHKFATKDGKYLDRYPDICVHSEITSVTAVTINTDGYINANYLDGVTHQKKYIAYQAPLDNTINDFWQMIWEQNSRVIVMLTPLEEEVIVEGTPEKKIKSAQYWPWPDVSKTYGPFTVQRLSYMPEPMDSPTIKPSNIQITKF